MSKMGIWLQILDYKETSLGPESVTKMIGMVLSSGTYNAFYDLFRVWQIDSIIARIKRHFYHVMKLKQDSDRNIRYKYIVWQGCFRENVPELSLASLSWCRRSSDSLEGKRPKLLRITLRGPWMITEKCIQRIIETLTVLISCSLSDPQGVICFFDHFI